MSIKKDFDYIDYMTSDQDHVSSLFSETEDPPQPTLRYGVVVEVLNDPGALPAARRDILYGECQNREYFISAPKNSVIVRDVTGGADKILSVDDQRVSVAYPIFPPHIALPVKAGETVFLIDPDPQNRTDLMFWLCRIPAADYVDDINFTHWDRTLVEIPTLSEKSPGLPEFLNGINTADTYTLANPDDFDMIFTGSVSNASVNFEAVPRFTKRPGDLVLQGSNNALICLGEDRGWTGVAPLPDVASTDPAAADGTAVSNANMEPVGGTFPWGNLDSLGTPALRGSIDIVVGRGQIGGTEPLVIANSRGWEETNKNPVNFGGFTPAGSDEVPKDDANIISVDNNWYANPQEGDPDFGSDMSRIYVSMKTDGDANFLLEYPDFAGLPAGEDPHVVLKSEEIRLVARETGSVRLIKEGTVADNQCVITMLDDGTIAIDAKKIIIGDGRVDQIQLGNEATERIVLGDVLKTWIKDELLAELALHTHTCPAGVSGPPDQEPIFSVTISDKLDEPDDILSAIAFVGADVVSGKAGQIQAAG